MTHLFKYTLALTALCSTLLYAAEYHVSPGAGRDGNPGTAAAPFQTLQKAVEKLQPGDICWLRNGRYQATTQIHDLNGTADAPIQFKVWPGERAVMDGTILLQPHWTPWKNGIYKMKLKEPVWQLFCGSKLIQVARWPNASFDDGSIWRMEESMRFTDRQFKHGKFSGKTSDGLICDRNPEPIEDGTDDEGAVNLNIHANVNQTTLAETHIDFTGALAVLNIGHWLTWTRPITDHKAGRDWFRYDKRGTSMSKYVAYYILGLQALDRPNEWWYDARTQTAYLRPPGDRNPNRLPLSGKVRDFSLKLENCSHLFFQGVEFFASTFSMYDCNHVQIEDGRLMYPSTHKFMLGEFGWFSETSADPAGQGRQHRKAKANVMTHIINQGEGPFDNAVRNCEIGYVNSPALYIDSPGSILENCDIHDIEWDVNSSGGSGSVPAGRGVIIRRNTIHSGGNSEGIRPGPDSLIEYNRLWDMGNLQHDGSAIDVGTGAQTNTVVRYNWVHDTNRQGIRFDSTTSRMGSNGYVHHNVIFNLGQEGSKFKGDHHQLFNNTFFKSYFAIPNGYGNTPPHNHNTLVFNNLADSIVAWTTKHPDEKLNAQLQSNISGATAVERNLRDPAHLDFRPRPGAEVVDAGQRMDIRPSDEIHGEPPPFIGRAPDIGAYEYGAARYWIPGCKKAKASTPIPPNGSSGIKPDADLMFLGAYKAHKHLVNIIDNNNKNSRKHIELNEINLADPGDLDSGQTYTWRVDAVMPDGSVVKGDTWTFTVE